MNFKNKDNFDCNFENLILNCQVNYEGDFIDFDYKYKNKNFMKILIVVQ